jgi:hypothetical protein
VAVAEPVEEEPVEEPTVSEWTTRDEDDGNDAVYVPAPPVTIELEEDPPLKVKRGNHPLEVPTGHYVIAGAFSIFGNAEKYSDYLFKKGHPASFGFLTEKKLFYVWIYTGNNADATRRYRDFIRQNKLFSDAWYLLVEN